MRIAALIASLLMSNAFADDEPLVRVEVGPEEVTVGESVKLRITVLGPTWFPKPPRYPSFEITNAVVRLPPDSSFPISERIGRDTWSGIVRNYEITPLIGGSFQLDDLVMQVTYADPETVKPVVANISVPDIAFRSVVPAGAEELDPYLAGTGFTLRREIKGETTDLEVGDALVLNYVAELEGLPSMFIPEFLQTIELPGVSVYPEEPEYNDDPVASRSEQLTLVFEAGGDFEIPAIELNWWNLESEVIETASLPALTLTVAGPPVAAPPPAEEQRELSLWRIAVILGLIVLAFWILRRIARAFAARRAERERQMLASAEYSFELLQRALASGDAHLSYERLLEWLGRLEGSPDPSQFATDFGDENLRKAVAELRASLYSGAGTDPDLRELSASLGNAYRTFHRAKRQAAGALLPGLNP